MLDHALCHDARLDARNGYVDCVYWPGVPLIVTCFGRDAHTGVLSDDRSLQLNAAQLYIAVLLHFLDIATAAYLRGHIHLCILRVSSHVIELSSLVRAAMDELDPDWTCGCRSAERTELGTKPVLIRRLLAHDNQCLRARSLR